MSSAVSLYVIGAEAWRLRRQGGYLPIAARPPTLMQDCPEVGQQRVWMTAEKVGSVLLDQVRQFVWQCAASKVEEAGRFLTGGQ